MIVLSFYHWNLGQLEGIEGLNGMIFSEVMFTKVSVKEMYKPQMDGLGDKLLKNFNPVAFSSVFVAEKRKDGAEKEFIESYLEAARIIS